MVNEAKTKKNPDYTTSAVNLCNPEGIQNALRALDGMQASLNDIQQQINDAIPVELATRLSSTTANIAEQRQRIQSLVDGLGSYQDVALGWYAVKQRRTSISYDPVRFEKYYPQFAPVVIIKAVDTVKLKGLVKGGLITEEELRRRNPKSAEDMVGDEPIAEEFESYSYIIKV